MSSSTDFSQNTTTTYMQLNTAMALNNIGVSLMERSEFASAFQVLRSAMNVMKQEGSASLPSLQDRVQQATRVLQDSQDKGASATSLVQQGFIQIVANEDLAAVIRDQQADSMLCALRFESSVAQYLYDHDEHSDCNNKLWFPVSILLHNVGIAHYCAFVAHYRACSCAEKRNKALEASYQMSHIVAAKCQAELGHNGGPQVGSQYEVQCMMILTLQSLETLSHLLGAPEKRESYEHQRAAALRVFTEFDALCNFTVARAA